MSEKEVLELLAKMSMVTIKLNRKIGANFGKENRYKKILWKFFTFENFIGDLYKTYHQWHPTIFVRLDMDKNQLDKMKFIDLVEELHRLINIFETQIEMEDGVFFEIINYERYRYEFKPVVDLLEKWLENS